MAESSIRAAWLECKDLWLFEHAVLQKLLYKNKNQHRRAIYFRYMQQICKRDSGLSFDQLVTSEDTFLGSNTVRMTPSILDCGGNLQIVADRLLNELVSAAAQLRDNVQTINKCAVHMVTLLQQSYFMSFALTTLAVLGRISVLELRLLAALKRSFGRVLMVCSRSVADQWSSLDWMLLSEDISPAFKAIQPVLSSVAAAESFPSHARSRDALSDDPHELDISDGDSWSDGRSVKDDVLDPSLIARDNSFGGGISSAVVMNSTFAMLHQAPSNPHASAAEVPSGLGKRAIHAPPPRGQVRSGHTMFPPSLVYLDAFSRAGLLFRSQSSASRPPAVESLQAKRSSRRSGWPDARADKPVEQKSATAFGEQSELDDVFALLDGAVKRRKLM